MVGGRKVLLSIAALSGFGFDNALGGQLGRNGGANGAISRQQPEVVPVSQPPATVARRATSSEESAGSIVGGRTEEPPIPDVKPASASDLDETSLVNLAASSTSSSSPPPVSSTDSTKAPPTRVGKPESEGTENAGSTGSAGTEDISVGETLTSTLEPFTPPSAPDSSSSTSAADVTTPDAATATPPRGGPPRGGPSRAPTKGSSASITQATTETVDLGYGQPTTNNGDTTFATSIRSGNQTFTNLPSQTLRYCHPSEVTPAPTSWSVVHTTTVTWYGNPDDYTQPYPPISVPDESSPATCIVPVEPPKFTISVCASTGEGTQYLTCDLTTRTESYGFGIQTSATPQVVFLTTDKNPAVVYSTLSRPDYGVSQGPETRDDHATPTGASNGDHSGGHSSDGSGNANGNGNSNGNGTPTSRPGYRPPGGPQGITESAQRPTPTPITVAVQPTGVVINGHTIRDNPAQPTQVVIIAGETFTINPTRVVGGGATIDRPSATGGVYLPSPTSTNIAGVPVVVSSSVAIIGGSSFTLGPTPTTAVVSGQTFTIGPNTIAGASQTLPLPTLPSPTEVVVAGGDLITAIGSSVLVIHGTTLTYAAPEAFVPHTGTDSDGITVVTIDDDVLTLGPGGVTAQHGSITIGGSHASGPQDTQYALVGGATVTKVGASVVVINGVSYTIGPGTGTTTTAVGGETVTVAPDGVVVGSLSLNYPFGVTTVITPGVGAGGGPGAHATGKGSYGVDENGNGLGQGEGGNGADGGDGEEDGVGAIRPWLMGVGWGVGVAMLLGALV
ncbi:hypothetical protein B0J18DRAFT_39679 [Chaetomium sp. MPI-SDFR-AT-0129]|nr:hypothetical protein B0J18DRAFT_39679 [Chaetomium sp. MPI-SDFR-AT-0129]